MFVEDALAGITQAQYALQTIAAVWQLSDYRYPTPAVVSDGDTYDFIVVGAGSAGCVLASRLSENPKHSVCLIEAGGVSPIEANLPGGAVYLQNSHLDWDQEQQCQVDEQAYQCLRNKRQPVSHGKMLGGSSSINLMMYMRGHPTDYDKWANLSGDESWKYENVLEYFIKSERLTDEKVLESPYGAWHGTNGPMGVSTLYSDLATQYINIYKEMGYPYVMDLNSNGSLGFTEQMVTLADGLRQSTANAHLSQAKGRSNLHVLTDARVTKIIFDENKRATGVQFLDKNNNIKTLEARKEVILSAGAINSPHLLLLSGVGPEAQLKEHGIEVVADLPVGQKLLNHHGVFLVYSVEELNQTAPQSPPNPHDFPAPIVTGLLALNRSQTYPDYMAATVPTSPEAFALVFCLVVFAFDHALCQDLYNQCQGRRVLFGAIFDASQENRGTVYLNSADPTASPGLHIDAYPSEEAYQKVIDYVVDFARIINTTHFRESGAKLVTLPQCKQYDLNSRDYLDCYGRCMSSTYYHYVATNAMGLVTDSRCRLMNTTGIRVADSSIIPATPHATTNAPSILVGEKCAAMIIEDNQPN